MRAAIRAQKHTLFRECTWLHAAFDGLDTEKSIQFVLPLTKERLRYDQKNARRRAFRAQLGKNQSRLNGLSQPDFISQDAAALWYPLQGKDHSVDLVGIGIDPPLPLGGCVTFLLVCASQSDNLFGEIAALNRVRCRHFLECILIIMVYIR